MNFLPLIERKRDNGRLTPSEIKALVGAICANSIPDYQLSALLMAIFFRGLDQEEKAALTLAMRDSGAVLSFPTDARPLVDKHSTGGVGDKVSLPLAPLLACLGFRVPMISGRGLGITGGTLDKLETIPGFTTTQSVERTVELVQQVGCCIVAQSAEMVPADKRLYALRDVSGTVPSIPLITASILSKKLAENLDALILDVKWGAAAFMQTRSAAEELAQSMVELSNACGTKTMAFLSNMDVPLGRTAGNWLEVVESVECLEGNGPQDLRHLVLECAAHLLVLTEKAPDHPSGLKAAAACLDSGEPRLKFDEMLAAQGADMEAFQAQLQVAEPLPVYHLRAVRKVRVLSCDARLVGETVRALGGGRFKAEDRIQPYVGVSALAQTGEELEAGATLCTVHATTAQEAEEQGRNLLSAFSLQG